MHEPVPLAKGELMKEARAAVAPDVFLAHSNLDRDHVERTVALFKNLGATAYTDYSDASLPAQVTTETARTLRERIAAAQKFVLLASTNIKQSRWTPWELGLADGLKGGRNVCLLPISGDVSVCAVDQEYLRLYPTLVEEQLAGKSSIELCVKVPDQNRFWTLDQWLKMKGM